MTNKFIMLDGTEIKTERFMQGPTLGKGRHWRIHDDKTYVETLGDIESIDPNKLTLFGYDADEFMARQYK